MIPSDQSPGWGRDHGGQYDHGVMVKATAMASNDADVAPSAAAAVMALALLRGIWRSINSDVTLSLKDLL